MFLLWVISLQNHLYSTMIAFGLNSYRIVNTDLLLISLAQLKRVFDPLLVLPVPDVDEAEEVLVAVPKVPLHTRRPRPRHGARAASNT